jgi:transposase-like protein
MEAPKTLTEAIQHFSTPENCRKFMVAIRWMDGIVRCPHCGSEKVAYLEKSKLYFCSVKHPRQKFSLKVGTVLEDSPIGLEKWFPAMWLLCNSKNGVSSYELSRSLGVTQKSAWFMLHRIRLAMATGSLEKIGGTEPVEIDETWVGGKPRNMHREKRLKLKMGDRETRRVRAKVIPNVKRETLQAEILANVQHKATVYTDGYASYDSLKRQEFVHETVNHMEEYVRGQVHTQGIENFWSLLKRSLNGTYVAVEPFHLSKYVDEQAFRYNNRATKGNPIDDADRFMLAVSQIAGKRLTYKELTGKVRETAF